MINAKSYAALDAKSPLVPFAFSRRDPGANDVLIQIRYCGVCHSDIHQSRDEWGGSVFPMVPGHEIVGTVTQVGEKVAKFKTGDTVGVGCFVNSCRVCASCGEGLEQYCENGFTPTYNGLEKDGKTLSQGGYSNAIVVDQNYVLNVPKEIPLERAAPLLCAGITTYSPLKQWKVGKGHKIAVVGLGGLGHMAVKLAAAMGAEVTVLSTSPGKAADAKALGAKDFFSTRDAGTFTELANRFDFILDTVAASHDYNAYLNLLKRDGTMILVGVPDKPTALAAFPLILKRRRLVGSLIGGIKETQEMLDFCAAHKIASDVEVIPMQDINNAYERMMRGDVKYRFVIDTTSLK